MIKCLKQSGIFHLRCLSSKIDAVYAPRGVTLFQVGNLNANKTQTDLKERVDMIRQVCHSLV